MNLNLHHSAARILDVQLGRQLAATLSDASHDCEGIHREAEAQQCFSLFAVSGIVQVLCSMSTRSRVNFKVLICQRPSTRS
jgi:hypothetical protein